MIAALSGLLLRCQQDYNRREELLKMGDEGLAILCGLALFMGELFLNVTVSPCPLRIFLFRHLKVVHVVLL